tara:strand:+ start:52864 stop:53292 length:429 start_codon:yes stop_codon:yes gene_type:complete
MIAYSPVTERFQMDVGQVVMQLHQEGRVTRPQSYRPLSYSLVLRLQKGTTPCQVLFSLTPSGGCKLRAMTPHGSDWEAEAPSPDMETLSRLVDRMYLWVDMEFERRRKRAQEYENEMERLQREMARLRGEMHRLRGPDTYVS